MTNFYDQWWSKDVGGDLQMELDHEYAWDSIIDTIDENDIKGKTILDFGCNRGVLLRRLYDRIPYKKGVGVDLARASIQAAKENAGDYPVSYYVEDDITNLDDKFDTVVSTSVLYLIPDLSDHIQKIKTVLKEKGVYYTTFTDQSKNKSFNKMKEVIDKYGANEMQNHTLTEVVDCFLDNGFEVELIKEHTSNIYNVTNYKEYYLSVDDYIEAVENGYMIKARKAGN